MGFSLIQLNPLRAGIFLFAAHADLDQF